MIHSLLNFVKVFFQFYLDIIDIQYCLGLRFTVLGRILLMLFPSALITMEAHYWNFVRKEKWREFTLMFPRIMTICLN